MITETTDAKIKYTDISEQTSLKRHSISEEVFNRTTELFQTTAETAVYKTILADTMNIMSICYANFTNA